MFQSIFSSAPVCNPLKKNKKWQWKKKNWYNNWTSASTPTPLNSTSTPSKYPDDCNLYLGEFPNIYFSNLISAPNGKAICCIFQFLHSPAMLPVNYLNHVLKNASPVSCKTYKKIIQLPEHGPLIILVKVTMLFLTTLTSIQLIHSIMF